MMRISVIVPTYNRAEFVRATVDSILAQTLAPVEVIVVDDGSTDNTEAVCESFAPPVFYLRRANQGVSAARNAGIAVAKGDWLAFCDSDDLWDPHKLELQTLAIGATNAEWCATNFRLIDPSGRPVKPETDAMSQTFHVLKERAVSADTHFARWLNRQYLEVDSRTVTIYHGDLFGMLFLGNAVLPSTAMVSRQLIERAGPFDPALRRAEETEFFHRISAHARGAIVMDVLASYRVGHASIMTGDSTSLFVESALTTLEKSKSLRGRLTAEEQAAYREGRRSLRLKLAYAKLSTLNQREARREVVQAFREDRAAGVRGIAILAASFLPRIALRWLQSAKKLLRR